MNTLPEPSLGRRRKRVGVRGCEGGGGGRGWEYEGVEEEEEEEEEEQ
jgi:hypothetical protein